MVHSAAGPYIYIVPEMTPLNSLESPRSTANAPDRLKAPPLKGDLPRTMLIDNTRTRIAHDSYVSPSEL
jgi:hypothetical protein